MLQTMAAVSKSVRIRLMDSHAAALTHQLDITRTSGISAIMALTV